MISREISDTSIVISSFRHFLKWYNFKERRLTGIYHNSQTHRFANRFCAKVKICIRGSFFGRITEINKTKPQILENSWTVQYLINFYKRWKDKGTRWLRASFAIIRVKDTKKDLYFSPVKIISLIVVILISVNMFFSIALQRQSDLLGWLIRGLFLFSALSGLFCKADWPTIKRNSIILRNIGIN